MLWISDCAGSSPESQLKWYQFWNWYCISFQSGLALAEHVGPAEVGLLDGDDLADRAVVDPLDRFADAQVVAPAEARNEAQVLLLGLFGGGHRHLHARARRCRAAFRRRRACRRRRRPSGTRGGSATCTAISTTSTPLWISFS